MRDLLLGIDLGTSAVKTALFDRAGTQIASAAAAYPTQHARPGYAEQAPEAWWRATCRAVGDLMRDGARAGEVRAIGLSGQMHGAVLLRQDGSADAAIIWQDRRSDAQALAIRDEVGAEQLIALAGSPVAAGFQAATLRWLAEHDPAALQAARAVLLPKDWLGWRLTGVLATDPSDAAGTLLFDTNRDDWSARMLAAAQTPAALLPPILDSAALRGPLLAEAAAQLGLASGTPVGVGGGDTACALLASGVISTDTLLLNLSTGGQLVQPLASAAGDAAGRLHTFRSALPTAGHSGWYLMGATLAAGFALQWWAETARGSAHSDAIDRLLEDASAIQAGSDGLLFLPYLVGERTPHMDAHARAAFFGLTDAHGQAHMTRAVVEGATFAMYDAFCAMQTVAAPPLSLTLAGGGARSPLWQQVIADIFGVQVRPLLTGAQSAWGAALLVGESIGWWQAGKQALACAVLGEPVLPNRAVQMHYRRLFSLFQQAYQRNRALMRDLSNLRTEV